MHYVPLAPRSVQAGFLDQVFLLGTMAENGTNHSTPSSETSREGVPDSGFGQSSAQPGSEFSPFRQDEAPGESVRSVSRFVHTHHLLGVLKPGKRVLEVGGESSELTRIIARAGCRVVISDASEEVLDSHRLRCSQMEIESAVEGRVCTGRVGFSRGLKGSFDVVVSFESRFASGCDNESPEWSDLVRVCRAGGYLLLSVLSLWGGVGGYLKRGPEGRVFPNGPEEERRGNLPASWTEAGSRCEMFRAKDLRERVRSLGLEVVMISASNALSVGWGDFLHKARQDPDRWRQLIRLELKTCREEAYLDMGMRIILLGRKPLRP